MSLSIGIFFWHFKTIKIQLHVVPPLDEVLAFKAHFFLHAKAANFKPVNMNTFTDTKRVNVWYITRVLSRFDTNLAPIRWTIAIAYFWKNIRQTDFQQNV